MATTTSSMILCLQSTVNGLQSPSGFKSCFSLTEPTEFTEFADATPAIIFPSEMSTVNGLQLPSGFKSRLSQKLSVDCCLLTSIILPKSMVYASAVAMVRLGLRARNIESVMVKASGPLTRMTAMPPVPGAVAIAAMFIIIKSKVYGQQSTVAIWI